MAEEESPKKVETTSEKSKEEIWTECQNKMIVDTWRGLGFDGIIEIQWG